MICELYDQMRRYERKLNLGLLHLVFLDEVWGWVLSQRYAGWSCFRILNVIRTLLNCNLYLTGSQYFLKLEVT